MVRSAEARKAVASGGEVVLAADPRDTEAAIANRDEIEALLGRLDADEAQLVRLYHVERKSYGEISRATGMPLGSIGPALSRARQKMRGE
jgi:RNA polymerase sigma-70 factor (ECF subfamily)